MYTSYIGKKFLELYNNREQTNLTAEEFFDNIFFEVFFQDSSHLMHVGNSPFFQKPTQSAIEEHGGRSKAQLNRLKEEIASGVPNMSVFVGFAAKDLQGTTSGQLTSIDFQIDKEEMYASWIGQALAIGVSGGFVLQIDREEVIWALYTGWRHYRRYLEQTPNVKDKQIETWNGHWLHHSFSKEYKSSNPSLGFRLETSSVQGNIAIPTQAWSKVLFALAKKYPNEVLTAYCYSLSQTNTTLGFINLYLPEVRRLYEMRDRLYESQISEALSPDQIEQLDTFYSFKSACKMGTIGLKALEPKNLREYMPKGSVQYAQGKDFKFSDQSAYYNYQLLKLWIIAMLCKTELLGLAAKVAGSLIACEQLDERGKKVFAQLSEDVRTVKTVKDFIEKVTNLMENAPINADLFKDVVEHTLKMPSDNFPLFATLIKFEYQYQKHKNQ